jgi:hypothetical protein
MGLNPVIVTHHAKGAYFSRILSGSKLIRRRFGLVTQSGVATIRSEWRGQ